MQTEYRYADPCNDFNDHSQADSFAITGGDPLAHDDGEPIRCGILPGRLRCGVPVGDHITVIKSLEKRKDG